MSYYERHVFFCCNQRQNGETCCNDKGASGMRDYAKKRVKELGLAGPGKVRVNQAGCLDRCEEGPCVVVYRSEERRVGKECRSRWVTDDGNKREEENARREGSE